MPQEPIIEPGVAEPIHIVPATEPPLEPTAYAPVYTEPTRVMPAVAYEPVAEPVVPTVVPVASGPSYPSYFDRRPAWPYFIALLALLLGGLIGFLIGNGRNDQTASLTASTQPLDSTVTPSEQDLQNQVDLLTAAQKKSAEDLAALQATLAQTQAERDALAAQVGDAGGTATGLQAELDASKADVAKLQADVKTLTGQLDTANAALAQTQASLKTAQGQLDAANATLTALRPTPLANYVNQQIGKARADAQANGWTLIEQPANKPSAGVGTILEQAPGPNATMVTGSVLYVKVA
jgi:hypothetical protein